MTEDHARALELAAWQGGAPGVVTGTANFLYGLVFHLTGIHDMGMRFADGAALYISDTIVRNSYLANIEALEVAMIGTHSCLVCALRRWLCLSGFSCSFSSSRGRMA